MSKSSSGRITSALRNLQTGREFKVPKKVSRKRSSRDVTEVPPQKKSLSDDWLQTFAPKKAEDLAVHANKIQEVTKWLETSEENFSKKPNPILLLTGPAGCGKTATVVALAAEKDYNLVEWVTPIDTFRQYRDADEEGIEIEESKSEKFREFLFQASRFKSLFRKSNKRLLVVEDFPNFLLRDPQAFSSILDTWQISGRCPLIFIVTETKSKQLNISFNLFPDSLRSEYKISHISFNPISLTLMKKALQRITSALKEEPYSQVYKQPAQEVVDSVISSAMGDIRNAILNLQFVSQKDAILTIDIERVEGQKKGKGKTSAKLKTVGRDETITLMHALGRVFNPKYNEDLRLKHAPEQLSDDFETQPHNFIAFLHANYIQHVSSLEDCADIAENLSFSEFLSREWRSDEMPVTALIVATRGTMVHNSQPVSAWIPCKGPRKLTQTCSHEQHEMVFNLGYEGFHSMATAASDLIQYATLINKQKTSMNCDET